jgi:hypothetical protein
VAGHPKSLTTPPLIAPNPVRFGLALPVVSWLAKCLKNAGVPEYLQKRAEASPSALDDIAVRIINNLIDTLAGTTPLEP